MVEDIHAVHEALRERKVESVEAPHMIAKMPDHDLWLMTLKDPDGNVLGVLSEVRPA
jgi:methylmalonyl-CoA/ethylmalonyl-CoA epimerase